MATGWFQINHLAHLSGLSYGYLYATARGSRLWQHRHTVLAPILPTVDRLLLSSRRAPPSTPPPPFGGGSPWPWAGRGPSKGSS